MVGGGVNEVKSTRRVERLRDKLGLHMPVGTKGARKANDNARILRHGCPYEADWDDSGSTPQLYESAVFKVSCISESRVCVAIRPT